MVPSTLICTGGYAYCSQVSLPLFFLGCIDRSGTKKNAHVRVDGKLGSMRLTVSLRS